MPGDNLLSFIMTKTQFRILLVFVMVISSLGGFIDLIWPNDVTNQVTNYAEELHPEWSDTQQVFFIIAMVLVTICVVGSFIGLMFFKNWGRILFLLGFILVLPLYWPLGTTVTSPLSQLFYDLGCYGEGAILVLCYFSPVAKYFEKQI